ncbi:Uncharacterised protein [Mycobacteroides abscessus]|nr:Uncharacterised protein [Mycobacteroides abscessus]SKT90177.1 Uncharacterised protein [Mycobacteroides abscessus subsp. abscessus]
MPSAEGNANPAPHSAAIAGSCTSITSSPKPLKRSASAAVVTTAIGPASETMNSTRAPGRAGSIGR